MPYIAPERKNVFFPLPLFPGLLLLVLGGGFLFYSFLLAAPLLQYELRFETLALPLHFDAFDFPTGRHQPEAIHELQLPLFSPKDAALPRQLYSSSFWLFLLFLSTALALCTYLRSWLFYLPPTLLILSFSSASFLGLELEQFPDSYTWPRSIALLACLLPVFLIRVWGQHWTLRQRLLVCVTGIACLLFGWYLQAPEAAGSQVLAAQQGLLLLSLIAVAGMYFYIAPGFIQGLSLLLLRLNTGVGTNLKPALILISITYLGLSTASLLVLHGTYTPIFPVLPAGIFLLPALLGSAYCLYEKQANLKGFFQTRLAETMSFLTGAGLLLLLWGYAQWSANTPLQRLLSYLLLITQMAGTLMAFLYVAMNFFNFINSGTALHKVFYQPKILERIHMRLALLMGSGAVLLFVDLAPAIQAEVALSTNEAGRYWLDREPVKAAILYEEAWNAYRQHPFAILASATLRRQLESPRSYEDLLLNSFDFAPSPEAILLLAAHKQAQGNVLEGLFYLEQGVALFPEIGPLRIHTASIYAQLGEPIQAAKLIEAADADSPGRATLLPALAVLLDSARAASLPEVHSVPHVESSAYLTNSLVAAPGGTALPLGIDTYDSTLLLANPPLRRNLILRGALEEALFLAPALDSLVAQATDQRERQRAVEDRILWHWRRGDIQKTLFYLQGSIGQADRQQAAHRKLLAALYMSRFDLERAASVWQNLLLDDQAPGELPLYAAYLLAEHLETLDPAQRLRVKQTLAQRPEGERQKIAQLTALAHRLLAEMPQPLYQAWEALPEGDAQHYLAAGLLRHKPHLLSTAQQKRLLETLGEAQSKSFRSYLSLLAQPADKVPDEELKRFGQDPYLTAAQLVLAERETDPDVRYRLLQQAISYNQDPLLNLRYARAAEAVGLGPFATAARQRIREAIGAEALMELLELEIF
ncbi:MAG: hypothetical protein ACXIT9_00400 [Nitritalea sp.]